jgi:hypothetical protein
MPPTWLALATNLLRPSSDSARDTGTHPVYPRQGRLRPTCLCGAGRDVNFECGTQAQRQPVESPPWYPPRASGAPVFRLDRGPPAGGRGRRQARHCPKIRPLLNLQLPCGAPHHDSDEPSLAARLAPCH